MVLSKRDLDTQKKEVAQASASQEKDTRADIGTMDAIQTKMKQRNLVFISAAICVFSLIFLLTVALLKHNLSPVGAAKILDVTPTEIENDVLGNESHFIVKAENATTEYIRNTIYLEPAIDYHIVEVALGTKYEIVPLSSLSDNTVFNIASVEDEVVSYKWAYQTKKNLSVSKIYPANGANFVSENSVIEFSFSYPDIENVAEHFSITPYIEGSLEKLDFSWRFTPSEPLSPDTVYEITISAGLTYGEETMSEDFHSSFSTFEHAIASSNVKNQNITLDGVSTFTESENPIIVFSGNEKEYFDNASYVSIEKVDDADSYIRYLNGEQVATSAVGDYSFEKAYSNNNNYIGYGSAILNQTLPSGYYIFNFKSENGQNLYIADVEINNLAAYAFESERDALVWVAGGGELQPGIKVNYKGKDYTTGDNGLLVIKNISDYSNKLDYLKIGNTDKPLVIALRNFKNNTYPQGFIYTDRPLYTPSDTIKIWGYVPLSFFKDAPNRDNFSIAFDTIKEQITVDSEGFFLTEIKLDNYKDVTGDIRLEYNDTTLARRMIEVANYTLENYIYEFVSSKNYVYAGENIDFAVKVSHVTGFPAINKDVVVTYDNHDYYGTTNGEGMVNFSLPTSYSVATWDKTSNYDYVHIVAKSGGADYNKYSTGTYFYVLKNNLILSGTYANDANNVEFTAKTLNLDNNTKIDWFRNVSQSNYSGPAKVRFSETRHTRQLTGYRYNEYSKENEPTYDYNSTTSIISEVDAYFEDGKLSIDFPTDFKSPEENVYYDYKASVSAMDIAGRPSYSTGVTYYQNYYLGQSRYTHNYNAIETYDVYYPAGMGAYALYRFGLKDNSGTAPYSIGDTLSLGLYDYTGSNVENQGQVLAVAYQEDIISTNIFTDNTFDLEFDQKLYPGADVIGAYFLDGKFHRIAPKYHDYKEEDSKLNITIEPNQSSYQPGDNVVAKIIVTREDGSRANGRVNLSVVNEAVFSAEADKTSILSSIYNNKHFKYYSMSTFRDYSLVGAGGGMGAGGGGRSNFGDTIFFGEKNLENGEATFEFKLNDSITSFRLTAFAVENSSVINAGIGTTNISSYLPLSIATVMPKKVKNTDDLVLNATSTVSSGDMVDYTFTIKELDKVLTNSALPGQSVFVDFGKLDLGKYTVVISAQDSAGNTDEMIYPVEIIETAQEISVAKTVQIGEDTEITPTRNPIIVEIYDKDTSWYLKLLNFLESHRTSRLDTAVTYYKSIEYKNKYYGEESTMSIPSFNSYLTEDALIKPLENAEGDRVLTALANYYTGEYFNLKASNYGLNLDDDLTTTIEKLLVLSSFKAPVLLDLKAAASLDTITNDDRLLLGIAFAFIGDYDSAKSIYENTYLNGLRQDLVAILASFIDKPTMVDLLDDAIARDSASDYLPFAIISFFENNMVDLATKNKLSITVGGETENVEISPLEIIKKIYYINDLSSIKFDSDSDKLFATYYYQGKIASLSEAFEADITASLSGDIAVGQTVDLVLDISALTGTARNGELNIALPSNLKFSATFSSETGLYLVRNNNEYFKLSLSDNYQGDVIHIPLYVAAPGNYEFESVVFKNNSGIYHLSNNFSFDAS